MNVAEKIKEDYVTLRNFSVKAGVNYQSLRNCLCGQKGTKAVASVLIEKGYIESASELQKRSSAQ